MTYCLKQLLACSCLLPARGGEAQAPCHYGEKLEMPSSCLEQSGDSGADPSSGTNWLSDIQDVKPHFGASVSHQKEETIGLGDLQGWCQILQSRIDVIMGQIRCWAQICQRQDAWRYKGQKISSLLLRNFPFTGGD